MTKIFLSSSTIFRIHKFDFLDIWNSLIRNNYLIPYKVRTKDGTIKVVDKAYKVNMSFVRDCFWS